MLLVVIALFFCGTNSQQLCNQPQCIEPTFTCSYVTFVNGVREMNAFLGYRKDFVDMVLNADELVETDGEIVSQIAPPFALIVEPFAVHIHNLTWVRWKIENVVLHKDVTYNRTELCSNLYEARCQSANNMLFPGSFCEDGVFCNGIERCVDGACRPDPLSRPCNITTSQCREDLLTCVPLNQTTPSPPTQNSTTPPPTQNNTTPPPTQRSTTSPPTQNSTTSSPLAPADGALIGIFAFGWAVVVLCSVVSMRRK